MLQWSRQPDSICCSLSSICYSVCRDVLLWQQPWLVAGKLTRSFWLWQHSLQFSCSTSISHKHVAFGKLSISSNVLATLQKESVENGIFSVNSGKLCPRQPDWQNHRREYSSIMSQCRQSRESNEPYIIHHWQFKAMINAIKSFSSCMNWKMICDISFR